MDTDRAFAVAQRARPVVEGLFLAPWAQGVAPLRPTEADLAAVFREPARFAFLLADARWSAPRPPLPADHTELHLAAATAAMLQAGVGANAFPGGYRRLVPLLEPEPVWVVWKWTRPGSRLGWRFDGLASIGDRWVWFPKPWRALDLPVGTVAAEA